jgi:hypothetical protein
MALIVKSADCAARDGLQTRRIGSRFEKANGPGVSRAA